MPTGRMNREQFYGQLATLDEQRLKKALWNLYWRGSAAMRERGPLVCTNGRPSGAVRQLLAGLAAREARLFPHVRRVFALEVGSG